MQGLMKSIADKYGLRKLEFFFAFLISIMSLSFGFNYFYDLPPQDKVFTGMFLPWCTDCGKDELMQVCHRRHAEKRFIISHHHHHHQRLSLPLEQSLCPTTFIFTPPWSRPGASTEKTRRPWSRPTSTTSSKAPSLSSSASSSTSLSLPSLVKACTIRPMEKFMSNAWQLTAPFLTSLKLSRE